MERPVINFFDRETTDVELKQRLALKALDFLEKDQLVAIDGSSTNLQFAKNIPNGLKLTVLTNSYSIAHACSTVSYTHLDVYKRQVRSFTPPAISLPMVTDPWPSRIQHLRMEMFFDGHL